MSFEFGVERHRALKNKKAAIPNLFVGPICNIGVVQHVCLANKVLKQA